MGGSMARKKRGILAGVEGQVETEGNWVEKRSRKNEKRTTKMKEKNERDRCKKL